jgi:hypothetical protein
MEKMKFSFLVRILFRKEIGNGMVSKLTLLYNILGGAIASNQHLYLFPCDAEQVLSINTRMDELKLVGPLLLEGRNKFQNGFCARDGSVYGIPQNSRGVIHISPNKNDPQHGEPDVDLVCII